jgi:hypothetical protein
MIPGRDPTACSVSSAQVHVAGGAFLRNREWRVDLPILHLAFGIWHLMRHLILLGDSIFDNAAYTRGEPDVVAHLRWLLPEGWRATLLAVDGATTQGVPSQLQRLPHDATDLIVSVGGNDALQSTDLLDRPARSSGEVLDLLARRQAEFEERYRRVVDAVVGLGRPTTLCTIYNGAIPEPVQARRAAVGLTVFNDVILRVAIERRRPVLDLRLICNEPADYANPIEPSGRGGEKIARAIARAVGAWPETASPSVVRGAT